jgi:zinc transport system ATP-binding protein
MSTLISLKNVSVQYEDTIALKDVSLDIYPDDFLGIIGPNGGGKTTLVKAILGTLPHSGEVTYSPTISERGHRLIGYLPQQSEFDRSFPISVIEVVLSGLQAEKGVFGRYTSSDRKRAMQLLEMAGISEVAERQISEISGGQMQRALLCRAVILEPKLLILDEPTNFVDNQFENELYTLLKRLNDQMAIVMVSHDIGTITSVVKSIVCVNRTVHRHNSNIITAEQLENYHCPIQIISHGHIPHTVLEHHH